MQFPFQTRQAARERRRLLYRLSATGNLSIVADGKVEYFALKNQEVSTDTTTESSSFWGIGVGTSKYGTSQNTLTGLPTQLQSQADITSLSGGDQLLQGTQVRTGGTPYFLAGQGDYGRADARIILEGVVNTVQTAQTKESNYVVWQRQTGQGSTIQTLTLPTFTGGNSPVFTAPGGLTVQIPQSSDFKTQIQTLASQPGMGYLNDLTLRNDVNWQPVKLAYDQWSYKQEGLTPAGAALVAVAVAWAVGPAGSNLLEVALGSAPSAFASAVANAAFVSLASQASITLINNKGNIGKTLSDLASSNTVKAVVTAALTAGALDKVGSLPGMEALKANIATSGAFTDKLTLNLINATGRAVTYAAINGTSLESALKDALIGGLVDTLHGEVAGQIKGLESEYVVHKLAHALAGCVAGAAVGGACQDGAIGAAVGEVVAGMFTKPGAYASDAEWNSYDAKVMAYSKLIAGGVSAYSGGNAQTAITTAETAIRNNYLTFDENQLRKQSSDACKTGNAQACADEKRWNSLDIVRDEKVRQVCAANSGSQDCKDWRDMALLARTSYGGNTGNRLSLLDELRYGKNSDAQELQSIQRLLSSTPYPVGSPFSNPVARSLANIVLDLTPIVGDAKAFYEAKDPFDYALAMLGTVLGPVGDGAAAAIRAAKTAHQAGNAVEAAAQLNKAEKLIEANVGAKGSWSTGINGVLESHATYKLNNGHIYKTDTVGRVAEVEGDLAKVTLDRNTYQQCVAGKCGELGDQGGHLIAAALGGAGDRINLVPQAATLNNGAWKAMENEFRDALAVGKAVAVKIQVGYPPGGGVRPSEFFVTATIDGKIVPYKFIQ